MHIPDGFLDTKTALATAALSAVSLAAGLRSLEQTLPRRKIPLMGLVAAFVFAAQMVNFPVAGGTSGHLMGGVLTAVLLGPSAGMVVLAAVLIVQCFLFADGGVLALGANILNMGIAGTVGGYAVYRGMARVLRGERGRYVAMALGAWCSSVFASVLCAGELAWSGTVSWDAAFPAMANIHMLIGIGEAVITVLATAFIAASRPDLLARGRSEDAGNELGRRVTFGAVIVIALVLFVSPFASDWPDGLESVAAALGFDRVAVVPPPVPSPMAGYAIPGIGSPAAATVVAGAVGAIVIFAVGFILARIVVPARQSPSGEDATDGTER